MAREAGKFFLGGIALLLAWILCAADQAVVTFFGSEFCTDCQEFKQQWQEEMTEEGDPVLVYVCIDDLENYAFLKSVEGALQVENATNVFPVMLAGRHFLYGVEEIRGHLEEALAWSQEESSPELLAGIFETAQGSTEHFLAWNAPRTVKKDDTSGAIQSGVPRLLYLETAASCSHCERQERELELLKAEFPALEITKLEVTTLEGQIYLRRFLEHFQIVEDGGNLAPLVAWNGGYVSGRLATCEELAGVLRGQEDLEPFWNGEITEAEREAQESRNRTFLSRATWGATLYAGLLDGINPCAFATAIFLISYLLYLKKGRGFVLAVGICFCLGVFLAYLLMGVGLSFVMDFLNQFAFVKIALYALFALVGICLAVLHLRDALRYKKSGKASDMEMGLNVQTHRKIHDKIHAWGRISSALAFPAAIVLGVVVSSMEFVCTGQIYLPTLMTINAQGFNLVAFQWLLIYNLAFIFPLLVVTVMAYFGVGAQALSQWARTHVFATKIAMAVLFLLLAALMLAMMRYLV